MVHIISPLIFYSSAEGDPIQLLLARFSRVRSLPDAPLSPSPLNDPDMITSRTAEKTPVRSETLLHLCTQFDFGGLSVRASV